MQLEIPRIYNLAAYLNTFTDDDDATIQVPPVPGAGPHLPVLACDQALATIESLHISLGDVISRGPDIEKHHTVYQATVISAGDSESSRITDGAPHKSAAYRVPPMVIKIAPQRAGRRLAQEAAMYDRLKALQGTMIPLCFGYFRCFVDLTQNVVVPWSQHVKLPRDEDGLDIFDLPNQKACLNLLLLEDAGKKVPREPGLRMELRWVLSSFIPDLSAP